MLILGIILFGMVVGAGAQWILRGFGKVDWTMAIVSGLYADDLPSMAGFDLEITGYLQPDDVRRGP